VCVAEGVQTMNGELILYLTFAAVIALNVKVYIELNSGEDDK
jgi:hypothetical protein